MSMQFFDVIVAKQYETKQSGTPETKTAWNRVGRAWNSRSGDSLSFELYLFPNQRYVIQLRPKQTAGAESSPDFASF
jgi:hypothetical protein